LEERVRGVCLTISAVFTININVNKNRPTDRIRLSNTIVYAYLALTMNHTFDSINKYLHLG